VYFAGNEYKSMPEKMALCDELPVALFITQASDPAVHGLYRSRLRCSVAHLPGAGLDSDTFRPNGGVRPLHLGFRASDEPIYFGHQDRLRISEYFQAEAARLGLRVDLSMNHGDRLAPREYAEFLNRCEGQLGTEGGPDCFELTDRTRNAIVAYLQDHPRATVEQIRTVFSKEFAEGIPLKIITGRHLEAAGTKTVQILFEGRYDDYLTPDEDYLALKKDFSNIDDVMRRFRDPSERSRIADHAYDTVRSRLTYEHLLDRFYQLIQPLI
jgi:hypothetical protein